MPYAVLRLSTKLDVLVEGMTMRTVAGRDGSARWESSSRDQAWSNMLALPLSDFARRVDPAGTTLAAVVFSYLLLICLFPASQHTVMAQLWLQYCTAQTNAKHGLPSLSRVTQSRTSCCLITSLADWPALSLLHSHMST